MGSICDGAVVVATCTVIAACGRIGFGAGDGTVGDAATSDTCATAVFDNPGASTFTDDFMTGALTDHWSPIAPCIEQVGGELVATPSPTGSYCHAWTNASFHLTCDHVMFEVPEATTQVNGAQTFIYIENNNDSSMTTDVLLENGFQFAVSTQVDPIPLGPYDAVQALWWRLQEDDGQLTFLTSPDGVSWTTRGSTPDPMPLDDVDIAIGAGTWQAVPDPGRARFHCYNLPPPCS